MIFYKDTHFIHEFSNELILNLISFTNFSILSNIKNQSITHNNPLKTILLSYELQAPKIQIDNRSQMIVVSKFGILF